MAIERTRADEERRRLEAQMQRSQKLESLGILAGGVTHDFNNLLTAMLAYAEMAQLQLPDDSPAVPMIEQIVETAERAADLARQMLAYSGRGKFVVGPVRLDLLVHEMATLLSTVIAKKAELQLDLGPVTIEGDATHARHRRKRQHLAPVRRRLAQAEPLA
jgi:signal transduction histidine kinase